MCSGNRDSVGPYIFHSTMVQGRQESDFQRPWRQVQDDDGGRSFQSIPKPYLQHAGSQPQSSKRKRVQAEARRDTRLAKKQRLQQQPSNKDTNGERRILSSSSRSSVELSHSTQLARGQKRKRIPEIDIHHYAQRTCSEKRSRAALVSFSTRDKFDEAALRQTRGGNPNPINYWRKTGNWPREYFNKRIDMNYPLARTKSSSSLRSKRFESFSVPGSTTPSDQKPREEKSAPYRHARYETVLNTKGSFMAEHEDGINKRTKDLCFALLDTDQKTPEDSLFNNDIFKETYEAIRGKNEARVIRDISLLIVPSAEILARRRPKHQKILIESVNEGWNSSISLIGTRPQPDFSVGLRRDAFNKDQLDKLRPFIGEIEYDNTSFFMGTYYMYFPFFTCEVKCGAEALDIADRQNAHSMTLAVRGIIELFRLVKREKELDREILAFSVSHDYCSVRIYGHYPVFVGKDVEYYRQRIRSFDFTELDGREKWTAYKFTKNVYDIWMPGHFKRICSAIDQIPPNLDFDVSRELELQFSEPTGSAKHSQELEDHHRLRQSNIDPVILSHERGNPPTVNTQIATPDTSASRSTRRHSKVPKRKHTRG